MPQQDIQTVIKDPKFLALDGDSQVQVLQHMRSLQPAAAPTSLSTGTPPPPPDPDDTPGAIGATVDVLKNMGKRAWQTGKGIASAATDLQPPSTPEAFAEGALKLATGGPFAYNAMKGAAGAAKTAVQQSGQLFSEGAASQDPTTAAKKYARGVGTAASVLVPPVTGTVTDVNKLVNEGKNREAMGTALFDGLLLLAGGKGLFKGKTAAGKAAAAKGSLDATAAAVGETGETVKHLQPVMDDLAETARQSGGMPEQTIGGLKKLVTDTSKRVGGLADAELDPTNTLGLGQQRVPGYGPGSVTGSPSRYQQVANAPNQPILANNLMRIAAGPRAGNLAHTPAGAATRQAAVDAINTYVNKPWTYSDMSLEVHDLRQQLKAYYEASPSEKRAMMTDSEFEIKKMVADQYSEEINNALQAKYSNAPPGYFQMQRQKQAHLISINDQLEKRIGKVTDKEATHSAQDFLDRINTHAYLAGGGPRAHVSGFMDALGPGPMEKANKFVAKSRGGLPPRTAILGLPVAHLAELPPPPQDSDNQ